MPVTEDVPTTTVSTTTTPAYVPFTGSPSETLNQAAIVDDPKSVVALKSGRVLNWSSMGQNSNASAAINFVTTISTPKLNMDLSDVSMDDDDDDDAAPVAYINNGQVADGRSASSSPAITTTTTAAPITSTMTPQDARLELSSSSSVASESTESPSSIDSGECTDNGSTYKVGHRNLSFRHS